MCDCNVKVTETEQSEIDGLVMNEPMQLGVRNLYSVVQHELGLTKLDKGGSLESDTSLEVLEGVYMGFQRSGGYHEVKVIVGDDSEQFKTVTFRSEDTGIDQAPEAVSKAMSFLKSLCANMDQEEMVESYLYGLVGNVCFESYSNFSTYKVALAKAFCEQGRYSVENTTLEELMEREDCCIELEDDDLPM
ncbi:MAG: hypothetical protein ACPGTQ_10205 [Colwellia sp.]